MTDGKRFSAEQLAAINTEGNVIVSAGAGSGKTTVMIERIVKKIEAGHGLDKMLIVTFTRASAADIKIKLAKRLTELKRSGVKAAATALDDLPVCNIGTLHSFCQRIIRSYFYVAGIDPAATVADEADARAMLYDSIKQAVRAAKERRDPDFMTLCDALCTRRDDGGAIAAVENIIDYARSISDTDGYLNAVKPDSEFFDALDTLVTKRRDAVKKDIEDVREEIYSCGVDQLKKAVDELVPYIEFKLDEVTRTSVRGGGIAAEVNESYKAVKEKCAAYRKLYMAAEKAKTVESSRFSAALCRVAADALIRYKKRKDAFGRIDYSDLEHGALKVLSDGACMAELAAAIDFVFIDEYQDVNPLQAEIAELLKAGTGAEMFLVGDLKQSIYGFRRCNPRFFATAFKDPDYTPVLLNRNYRSGAAVIDFINAVFKGVMTEDFGGADYSRDKLVATNAGEGDARFFAVPCEREKSDVGNLEPYSVVNAAKGEPVDPEARFIVDTILDYIEEQNSIAVANAKHGEKPSGFSSIAVLVRSARTPFCEGLVALMRKNGIPVSYGVRSKICDYPEVEALYNIAKYIDCRFDDVALYTALRSPMGGFSDAELLKVADDGERAAKRAHIAPFGGGKAYTFWQKAECYDGELLPRLRAFYALRDSFAAYSDSHDAADTLGRMTAEIDYFQHVFEHGGSAAAVEAFIALAASKKCDLCSFLQAVDKTAELGACEGGDAVTVSTIHAAKGLEYDMVIVADTARKINLSDASARVLAAEGGVAVKYPDAAAHEFVPSAPYIVFSDAIPDKLRAEELRLFYVALTRAKKRLVVCGKRGESREPRSAVCEFDFMKNVVPELAHTVVREADAEDAPQQKRDDITAAVKDRCDYSYVPRDTAIKTCVTAIAASGEDYTAAATVLTDDDFVQMSDDEVTERYDDAARRGTAYHRAMELVDLFAPKKSDIEGMDDRELVDYGRVERAAKIVSELAAGAAHIFKERCFMADMKDKSGESVLVQGVIDLLIVYGNGDAAIVDYKTTAKDRLFSGAYKTQLDLYKRAVEMTTPYKVTGTYLYSFELAALVKM